MTPRELNLCIYAYKEKQKVELEEKLTVSYFGALWQRVDKLSIDNLKDVLKKLEGDQSEQKKKMTPEEMLNEVKKLNATFGGITY
jgi:hypothetical protein